MSHNSAVSSWGRYPMLSWFKLRDVGEAGAALADQCPRPPSSGASGKQRGRAHDEALRNFFLRAIRDPRIAGLNFIKRAWLANSFKWRLLEKGVDAETANEWTQTLVLEISSRSTKPVVREEPASAQASQITQATQPAVGKARNLSALADEAYARGAYGEAVAYFQELVTLKPRDVGALNNLGGALIKLGRYGEAEDCLRKAIRRRSDFPEAHGNLGIVYLDGGHYYEAEQSLRRAVKSKPAEPVYRCNLGLALTKLGKLPEAKAELEKVLRVAPRNAAALVCMGLVAKAEGRFDDAETFFRRALEINPTSAAASAALVGLRKMTTSDGAWLTRAEQMVADGVSPQDEATLRFAMGKYCDDIRDFKQAFANYQRANQLLKATAATYRHDVRSRLVDDLIRVYTPQALAPAADGCSDSNRPVFVVGMMRSGTSLVEQILASHPAVVGAGELDFWNDFMLQHHEEVRREVLAGPVRKKLAGEYLQLLSSHSADALRVVDKATLNSDYLGMIHSVFPHARFVYVRRDPIDTCLSCYFQHFPPALNFTMDLEDLAHYYREHRRLMSHWRAVLPEESILEVPYEELVADQEGWTRRMLGFLNLEWDPRCLEFHRTTRAVATASYWQVRQRIYNDSVERWRHYRKFIAPLLDLRE
jgi:tetratricopeptide (TPR) repeat protein